MRKDFWDFGKMTLKDFGKHLNYLKQNVEDQEIYSSKFNEILNELDFRKR